MALYKDYKIDGGVVTLNMDPVYAVVHTDDAVWLWDQDGAYFKINVENGTPVTHCSRKTSGGREFVKSDWQNKVCNSEARDVRVELTGGSDRDREFARAILEQIYVENTNVKLEIV